MKGEEGRVHKVCLGNLDFLLRSLGSLWRASFRIEKVSRAAVWRTECRELERKQTWEVQMRFHSGGKWVGAGSLLGVEAETGRQKVGAQEEGVTAGC